ncbi:MAG: recombinase family protein [Chloroflexi bacterium]|nr:recombinase family protein [Chloroflexota bacterium]
MTRKPIAYLRRSHAGGNGNGRVSFEVQHAAVLDVARRHGDAQPEVIVEWGVSGADATGAFGGTGRGGKRRAYYDLRDRIERDEVSALYSYSLSRLARSTRELLDLAEACVAHDVPIRLDKEGTIDATSPSGRLYLTVLAGVASFEAEVAAERARDRTDQMREQGAYVGRNPYGYLIDDGRLVPDPLAVPTIKKVIKLYRDLKSPAKVARALNDAKVPAPQGGKWGDGTVRRIVSRQPGHTPPQTVRGSRAVPVARFARLLVCACGRTMTPARKRYTTATGERRDWTGYTCPGARYDRTHPKGRAVAESVVLEVAMVEVSRLRLPDRVSVEAKADARRADLDARRGRIIDALEAGAITRAEAEPRLARIAGEVDAIDAETQVVRVPKLDWSWPAEQVNSVLRTFWERIDLGPDMTPTVFVSKLPPEYWA